MGSKWGLWACLVALACSEVSYVWSHPISLPLWPFFDSAHSIALDGRITGGVLVSHSRPSAHRAEILAQLQYSIGVFNGHSSGLRLSLAEVHVVDRERFIGEGGRSATRVHYNAKFLVAWNRETEIPRSLNLILPAGGSPWFLEKFFNEFYLACNDQRARLEGPNRDTERFTVNRDNFWYHYRPEIASCPLANGIDSDVEQKLAQVVNVRLSLSDSNSTNRYPEYDAIWADSRLDITLIFSKYQGGATSEEHDAGIRAYNQSYRALREIMGNPLEQLISGDPGVTNPVLEMTFQTRAGIVNVRMELVDNLSRADGATRARLRRKMRNSDVVMYNGHAGLGSNVKALARIARFEPRRYQIYIINGCDSFSYADTRLHDAVARVNPQSDPSRYLDVILNAMPAYFAEIDDEVRAVVQAMLGQPTSYRQILSQFDRRQRAVVIGEEDNHWPGPF